MGGISAMKHPNKKVERKNKWKVKVIQRLFTENFKQIIRDIK